MFLFIYHCSVLFPSVDTINIYTYLLNHLGTYKLAYLHTHVGTYICLKLYNFYQVGVHLLKCVKADH